MKMPVDTVVYGKMNRTAEVLLTLPPSLTARDLYGGSRAMPILLNPCSICGSTERYKNGHCAPCTRASNQRWKERNREKHRAGSKRWAVEHPESVRSYSRQYARSHREENDARSKVWRADNPDRHVAHEHKRRALKAKSSGRYTSSQWRRLCEMHANRCLACGSSALPLTVDHVVPLSRGGRNTIENIQPLCGPCNSRKGTQTIDYRINRQKTETVTQLPMFQEGDAAIAWQKVEAA
jgi:5-methylcytosine-specific restriction endonuclease McrA